MTQHQQRQRRSLLDLTANQRQNLLAICGVLFTAYMIVTKFPIEPIWAVIISGLLFGQRLIPWGSRDESDRRNEKAHQVDDGTTGAAKPAVVDYPDVDVNYRNVRFCRSS